MGLGGGSTMDWLPGGSFNAPLLHPPISPNGLLRTEVELSSSPTGGLCHIGVQI